MLARCNRDWPGFDHPWAAMTDISPAGPGIAIGDRFTVDVGAPVAGGQCIARADGRIVFVRDAIPGERVEVAVTGTGKRGAFARADVERVITASPHRVTPPCPVARECGGCDWQHVDIRFQRQLKQQVVIDAFTRIGGVAAIRGVRLADAFVVEPVDRGDGLGWRTRMRYAVTPAGEIGLRAARSHRVIPATQCLIAAERIRRGVTGYLAPQGTRALIAVAPRSSPEPGTGPTTGEEPAPALLISDETADADTVPMIEERVAHRRFRVAASGFWQVHPLAASVLVETVLAAAAVRPGDRVFDLYSGVGLFASFLAEATTKTGRVDAVEGGSLAVECAKANLADLPWAHQHRSDVHRWLSRARPPSADVVVLDPPRAGAGRAVVAAISVRRPRTIVYVACDPVALARDCAYLGAHGFVLTSLRAFDLFPMTKHVECVATFASTPG